CARSQARLRPLAAASRISTSAAPSAPGSTVLPSRRSSAMVGSVVPMPATSRVATLAQPAARLQPFDDAQGVFAWIAPAGVDAQVRVFRHLVRVGNAGELPDLAAAGGGVKALAVARLAHVQRRGHVHLAEAAVGLAHGARLRA